MERVIVATNKGPTPKGQYSQVVIGGPLIFVSGQLPYSPEGVLVGGDVGVQTKQIMDNIAAMLDEAGSSLKKVVKVGIYIANLDDFPVMNSVYSTYFPSDPPARTTLVVRQFPAGVNIEIDVIALL